MPSTSTHTIKTKPASADHDFPATGERRAKLLRLKRRMLKLMSDLKRIDADPEMGEANAGPIWEACADAVVFISNETQTPCPELS